MANLFQSKLNSVLNSKDCAHVSGELRQLFEIGRLTENYVKLFNKEDWSRLLRMYSIADMSQSAAKQLATITQTCVKQYSKSNTKKAAKPDIRYEVLNKTNKAKYLAQFGTQYRQKAQTAQPSASAPKPHNSDPIVKKIDKALRLSAKPGALSKPSVEPLLINTRSAKPEALSKPLVDPRELTTNPAIPAALSPPVFRGRQLNRMKGLRIKPMKKCRPKRKPLVLLSSDDSDPQLPPEYDSFESKVDFMRMLELCFTFRQNVETAKSLNDSQPVKSPDNPNVGPENRSVDLNIDDNTDDASSQQINSVDDNDKRVKSTTLEKVFVDQEIEDNIVPETQLSQIPLNNVQIPVNNVPIPVNNVVRDTGINVDIKKPSVKRSITANNSNIKTVNKKMKVITLGEGNITIITERVIPIPVAKQTDETVVSNENVCLNAEEIGSSEATDVYESDQLENYLMVEREVSSKPSLEGCSKNFEAKRAIISSNNDKQKTRRNLITPKTSPFCVRDFHLDHYKLPKRVHKLMRGNTKWSKILQQAVIETIAYGLYPYFPVFCPISVVNKVHNVFVNEFNHFRDAPYPDSTPKYYGSEVIKQGLIDKYNNRRQRFIFPLFPHKGEKPDEELLDDITTKYNDREPYKSIFDNMSTIRQMKKIVNRQKTVRKLSNKGKAVQIQSVAEKHEKTKQNFTELLLKRFSKNGTEDMFYEELQSEIKANERFGQYAFDSISELQSKFAMAIITFMSYIENFQEYHNVLPQELKHSNLEITDNNKLNKCVDIIVDLFQNRFGTNTKLALTSREFKNSPDVDTAYVWSGDDVRNLENDDNAGAVFYTGVNLFECNYWQGIMAMVLAPYAFRKKYPVNDYDVYMALDLFLLGWQYDTLIEDSPVDKFRKQIAFNPKTLKLRNISVSSPNHDWSDSDTNGESDVNE